MIFLLQLSDSNFQCNRSLSIDCVQPDDHERRPRRWWWWCDDTFGIHNQSRGFKGRTDGKNLWRHWCRKTIQRTGSWWLMHCKRRQWSYNSWFRPMKLLTWSQNVREENVPGSRITEEKMPFLFLPLTLSPSLFFMAAATEAAAEKLQWNTYATIIICSSTRQKRSKSDKSKITLLLSY